MAGRPKLSQENRDQILVDYRAGIVWTEIAARNQVHHSTVWNTIRRANVTRERASAWTDEKIATLRLRCSERIRYALVAEELGLSRNAIIGKTHRLNISNGLPTGKNAGIPRPRSKAPAMRAQPRAAPKPLAVPVVRIAAPESLGLTLAQLTSLSCRYPYGTRAPFSYCGLSTLDPGASWCPYHRAIVFREVTPRLTSHPMRRAA